METTAADRMVVNDANSESSPGYAIVNARIISGAALGVSSAELTMGVQNLFDKRWVSSVSVNAAGGKFYEPGSQRSLYVGLSLLGAPKLRQ
jgi:iron complex outermembrane receptor protein